MAARDNFIEVENIFLGPEIHYCVVFRGETERYGDTGEIKAFLEAEYKIKPRMFDTASQRQPLIIFGPAGFQAAAEHYERIEQYGIACTIEAVEPPAKNRGPRYRVLETTEIPKAVPSGHKPASGIDAAAPGGDAAGDLYQRLNDAYNEVKTEFNIDDESKAREKKESTVGCLIFLFSAAALGAIIFTPLRWFWGAAGIFIIVTVLSSMLKEWDLLYIDSFLARLEGEKQRDPRGFARTMKKWVKNLPKNDRAKKHLETVILKLEQEARTTVPGPAARPPSPPPVSRPAPTPAPRPPAVEKTPPAPEKKTPPPAPPAAAAASSEALPLCPKCGSDWVRSEEKGREKIIYTCENCQKKWKAKR
jgi:hypothetical protein